MIIKCPNCGHEIKGPNKPGRKRYNVDFNNISKALQKAFSDTGQINQSHAARILSEKLGRRITPGFISNRMSLEMGKKFLLVLMLRIRHQIQCPIPGAGFVKFIVM